MITENYGLIKQPNSPNIPVSEGTLDGSLGIVAKTASASAKEATKSTKKLDKFALQNLSAELLPNEKNAQCLRHRAPVNYEKNSPVWATVEVHKNESDRAYYEHLMICDRVWGCPVCSSRISERRRQVLTEALAATDYRVVLTTLTLSHHMGDDLKTLLDAITKSARQMKSGRFWQKLKKEYSWVGDIKALEVTYGGNGWHPHIHILMLFNRDMDETTVESLTKLLKRQWLRILDNHDMSADWEHGCDVRVGDKYIQEYIAKFGKMPLDMPETGEGWTVEHELTKSQQKQGREGGKTPWEILVDYGRGDVAAGQLFKEYYAAFKGRKQLVWSPGLKDLLGVAEIEEALDAQDETEDTLIMEIFPVEWNKVCYHHARGEVLKIAGNTDVRAVWRFIENLPPVPE